MHFVILDLLLRLTTIRKDAIKNFIFKILSKFLMNIIINEAEMHKV